MAKQLRSITVRQLISALQDEDPDAVVVFASDYGDHGHTEQAHAIDGQIEPATLVESAYSHSGWAVPDEDSDEEEDDGTPVLVIR